MISKVAKEDVENLNAIEPKQEFGAPLAHSIREERGFWFLKGRV